MRLLDLFCGAGGAAMGYHRAGFDEIVGVDIAQQKRYPFEFVQADALEYVAEHGQKFDLIHASPPCQRYTLMNQRWPGAQEKHPDSLPPTREALMTTGRSYVIENVVGAPMRDFITLCGRSFGLGTHRHRKFETNFFLFSTPMWCRGWRDHAGVYGAHPDGGKIWTRKDGSAPLLRVGSLEEARSRMGINWMVWDELKEAIPPAYTEFIGREFLRQLQC